MPRVRNIKLTHKVMYEEFAEAVLDLIGKEKLWGRYLASENKLGKMFGVSRETVRRGMRLLEGQGMVSRQQGRGTYVLPKRKGAAVRDAIRIAVGYSGTGFGEGYASRIVAGLSAASAKLNAALSFVNLMNPETRRKLPTDLRSGLFDALALLSLTDRSYIEELLRAWNGPVVLMDHAFPDLPLTGVIDDGRGGGRQAAQHFLALGHRKIGFIDIGTSEMNPWRYAGYLEALTEADIEPDERWRASAFSSFESGRQAADRILALADPPTAILAFDEVRAWGAMRAAEARGLKIGRDLALAGFGDTPLTAGMPDMLTRVQFDACEIGRLAFENLKRQIQGKTKPGGIIEVPTQLIVRQSSGSGPKEAGKRVNSG